MDLLKLLESFRERCASSVGRELVRDIDVAAWLASQPAIDVGPRVCVAALVTDPAGFGLFVRNRKRNAASPTPVWELPGGGMLAGETWQEAVVREVREETGITIDCDGLSIQGVLHGAPKPGASFRSLIIVAHCAGQGRTVPGDDAIESRWFSRHMLPALADLDTARVARTWAGAW